VNLVSVQRDRDLIAVARRAALPLQVQLLENRPRLHLEIGPARLINHHGLRRSLQEIGLRLDVCQPQGAEIHGIGEGVDALSQIRVGRNREQRSRAA